MQSRGSWHLAHMAVLRCLHALQLGEGNAPIWSADPGDNLAVCVEWRNIGIEWNRGRLQSLSVISVIT